MDPSVHTQGRLLRRVPLVAASMLAVSLLASFMFLRAFANEEGREAREFFDAVPDQLPVAEGEVLHTVIDSFMRFGPKHDVIVTGDSGFASERFVRESWLRIGSGGTIVRSLYQDSDVAGVVYQEARESDDLNQVTDLRSGDILIQEPRMVTALRSPRDIVSGYAAGVESGTTRVVSQTSEEITLETRVPVPHVIYDGVGDYSVPYYADLDSSELVAQIVVRDDGLVVAADYFAVLPDGSEMLIQSERTTIEVVDALPVPITRGPLE